MSQAKLTKNPEIFTAPIEVINIGTPLFGDAIERQGRPTARVAWKPPVAPELSSFLEDGALNEKIDASNREAVESMMTSELRWIGMKRAIETLPGMKKNTILHAGPPIAWRDMTGMMQMGIVGGMLHEGLAGTKEEALIMAETGKIDIQSAYDLDCIGAGAGIVTASMIVNVVEDAKTGKRGHCPPFEGRDGLSLWGLYNEKVEKNLSVIETQFAPSIDYVLRKFGGVDVTSIIGKAVQMNDELHTRQTAASLFMVNDMAPKLVGSDLDKGTIKLCIDMLCSSERWFHPLLLGGAMAIVKGIQNKPFCTLAVMCCSNGVTNGVKISAMGNKWYYGAAPKYVGQYFSPEWSGDDAIPQMGDSTVAEVVGLGGFAAAASPTVLRLRDGNYLSAIQQSEEMKQIAFSVNRTLPIPLLDFTGPPIGLDARKVLTTGVQPIMHGAIISKAGGQIGAGAGRFPLDPYITAMNEFYKN